MKKSMTKVEILICVAIAVLLISIAIPIIINAINSFVQ